MGYRKERIKEKRKSSVIMTVQELIDALNKVEDKSKEVRHRLNITHRCDAGVSKIIDYEEWVVVY